MNKRKAEVRSLSLFLSLSLSLSLRDCVNGDAKGNDDKVVKGVD